MAIFRFFTAAAAIAALGACSMQQTPALPVAGTQNNPAAAISQNSPAKTAAPTATPAATPDAAECAGTAQLSVTPCRIEFSSSNSAPVTVTVTRLPGTTPAIAEHDDCTTANIAKLSQISADQWTVSAGTGNGACRLRFTSSGNADEDAATVNVQKSGK